MTASRHAKSSFLLVSFFTLTGGSLTACSDDQNITPDAGAPDSSLGVVVDSGEGDLDGSIRPDDAGDASTDDEPPTLPGTVGPDYATYWRSETGELELYWLPADDDITRDDDLQYKVSMRTGDPAVTTIVLEYTVATEIMMELDTRFYVAVPLAPGMYTFSIAVRDEAGNVSQWPDLMTVVPE